MRNLSPAALRILQCIADGITISGIGPQAVCEELQGLVGAAVPCLPNFVLTAEGVQEMHLRNILITSKNNLPAWTTRPTQFSPDRAA